MAIPLVACARFAAELPIATAPTPWKLDAALEPIAIAFSLCEVSPALKPIAIDCVPCVY